MRLPDLATTTRLLRSAAADAEPPSLETITPRQYPTLELSPRFVQGLQFNMAIPETVTIDVPGWDRTRALRRLGIHQAPFEWHQMITASAFNPLGGNGGYARGYAVTAERTIAVSPFSNDPHLTLFHEVAHCELQHVAESEADYARNECHAEAVAWLCALSLDLPADRCPEYIAGYAEACGDVDPFAPAAIKRLRGTARRILQAGGASRASRSGRGDQGAINIDAVARVMYAAATAQRERLGAEAYATELGVSVAEAHQRDAEDEDGTSITDRGEARLATLAGLPVGVIERYFDEAFNTGGSVLPPAKLQAVLAELAVKES